MKNELRLTRELLFPGLYRQENLGKQSHDADCVKGETLMFCLQFTNFYPSRAKRRKKLNLLDLMNVGKRKSFCLLREITTFIVIIYSSAAPSRRCRGKSSTLSRQLFSINIYACC